MAVFHGKSGKVNFSADLFTLNSWSLSVMSDVSDSTGMTDTWKTVTVGLKDFSANAEGFAETTVDYTSTLGTEASLKLYVDDSQYFSGNAICSGITETASIEDNGKVSYSFVGDSAAGITFT